MKKKDNDKMKKVGPNVERLWTNLLACKRDMLRLSDCHCGRSKIAEEFTMLSGVGPMIKQ